MIFSIAVFCLPNPKREQGGKNQQKGKSVQYDAIK